MSTAEQAIPSQVSTPAASEYQVEVERLKNQSEETRKRAIRAIYGSSFPLAQDGGKWDDADWKAWAESTWNSLYLGVRERLAEAQRNRLFRHGYQWRSRNTATGVFREPPMPKNSIRATQNLIGPSADWAIEVMSEQSPGWRFEPVNQTPKSKKKAEGYQSFVEYQYHQQGMDLIRKEAGYWAQTDGVSFPCTYWDPDRGPWEELLPGLGDTPVGDIATKVYRIEQVRVSPNASATERPMYWIVRELMARSEAVELYGDQVAEDDGNSSGDGNNYAGSMLSDSRMMAQPLLQGQQTVVRWTIHGEKNAYMKDGLSLIIVGDKVVYGPSGLMMGKVPLSRYTDGSTDPAFFPECRMNLQIESQMRVNMIWSKWLESIRSNAGGRYVSKSGAIATETFVGGFTSMLEIRNSGGGPISDSIMPVSGFSVGSDVKEALDREIKNIENLTGWNDVARGQFSTDQSGRAIIAQKEQLERTFAPFVRSTAEFMSDWAEQCVLWGKWGYQVPRLISVMGSDRPDLARQMSAPDFDEVVNVYVDPESLVPIPRAMRLYELDNALEKGLIKPDEYARRYPSAFVRDLGGPDEVQFAKGQRLAEAILSGQPVEAMTWQDDEKIMQDILAREIILQADTNQAQKKQASDLWTKYAEQAVAKAPKPPPPAPMDGTYQKFIQDVTEKVILSAQSMVAKEVQESDMVLDLTGTRPSAALAPKSVPPTGGTKGPEAGGSRSGRPLPAPNQPTLASNPSVAAASSSMLEHGGRPSNADPLV